MLRGIWVRCVLFVMTLLLATPTVIVTLLYPSWSNMMVHAGRIWSRALLAAAGGRVTYHGLENLKRSGPCIFIANHLSHVDIWVLLCMIPPSTRFVAKHELFRIPLFGWALASTGCIPIDRGNHAEALRSLRVAADRIRGGTSVVLFPEGTRSRDGKLRPFKKGAFHLALQAGVPVVPVAITGSFEVMPPRSLRVKPGPVDVFVEPAIDVVPFLPENHEGLRAMVHAAIERRFRGGAAEPDGTTVSLGTS